MPPIDPARLKERTAALAERFGDTAAVVAGVRALLDDYADRTYRPSPKVAYAGDYVLKVPAPVVRAVVQALRGPARANPAAALAIARGVWAGKSREACRIAAELLGEVAPQVPAEALALVETWLPQIDSSATAAALAERGLGPLIRAEPAAYLEHARRWVTHPQRWVRRFALAMLAPLLKDRHWDNVPGALSVVRLAMTETDGEVRRALTEVLEALAAKSPAEISRFLRDQAARANAHTHWIIRSVMPALPAADQAELVKALRR